MTDPVSVDQLPLLTHVVYHGVFYLSQNVINDVERLVSENVYQELLLQGGETLWVS